MFLLRTYWANGQQLNKCLMTLMLLLACVLANCAVHASEIEQLSQQMSQDSHQHDCCEPQEQCCEGHQGIFNPPVVDHVVGLSWQFDGFAQHLIAQYVVSLNHWTEQYLSSSPPIYLINCRFTI